MPRVRLDDLAWHEDAGGSRSFAATLDVAEDILLDVDVRASFLSDAGATLLESGLSAARWDVCWLPKGRYTVACTLGGRLPEGASEMELRACARVNGVASIVANARSRVPAGNGAGEPSLEWRLEAQDGTTPLARLPWRQGYASWFFQHFDHASRTLVEYVGGDSPLLRGRVLDVGCGDGITALGIALRYHPREIVGVDPYRTYENLPKILARHALAHLALPANLRFLPEDANALPFPDDSFDAVISWAAVEHFAGGYRRALAEMRRVLKRDGLLFIHPGLYYWNQGHHLAEYSSEPFFHLTRSDDGIREMVMTSTPHYADRGGDVPTREQHWRWFQELNRITVDEFEDALRALGFEPWRLALRTDPLVEYRPGMLERRFTEVGITELYVSCFNRKPPL
ncbi:MAG: class I SAM-dependent methyltransferase [Bacillota bacterium]